MRVQILLAVVLAGTISAFPQGGPHAGAPPATGRSARPSTSHRFFPGAFPSYWDSGYDYPSYGADYAPAPAPNVVVVQLPPPPSPPPTPEIHEYSGASAAPASDEQPAYAIALKDGSVHAAAAVTVQDNTLHYVDPDGQHRLVPLDMVDREATRRLNRERNLRLQLP